MAAPGIGAGDILTACKFIYEICVKYHDAPEQFDEIAEKADATKNVINRLEIEAATGGSLVERAGPEAEKEFQSHLDGLRADLKQLEKLVKKYSAIHDEGPGRRLLWAVWESGNLTEYRRKIGYHEQKLSFWYTNLTFGSLRRIENGQEEMICALNAMPKRQEKLLRDALTKYQDYNAAFKLLERLGIDQNMIQSNLPLVTNYVTANEQTKCQMTDYVRRRTHDSRVSGVSDMKGFPSAGYGGHWDSWKPGSQPYGPPGYGPPKAGKYYGGGPSGGRGPVGYDFENLTAGEYPGVRRSKSSRRAKEVKDDTNNAANLFMYTPPKDSKREGKIEKDKPASELRPGHERRKSDTPLMRRSKSPLIVIHDERSRESVQTGHRRTRSTSDTGRQPKDQYEVPVIVVEEEGEEPRLSRSRAGSAGSRQRDSSTSSYHRERPRSSSGASQHSVTQYRVIRALPRIDSIPVDEGGI